MSVMGLGHLLTRSGLTYLEVSSGVCHDSFCQLGNSVTNINTLNLWVPKLCPSHCIRNRRRRFDTEAVSEVYPVQYCRTGGQVQKLGNLNAMPWA